jgi:hypothetical protein
MMRGFDEVMLTKASKISLIKDVRDLDSKLQPQIDTINFGMD